MNDWYNDPPEQPEPPEWYLLIEAAMEERDLPDWLRPHLKQAIEDANKVEAERWDVGAEIFNDQPTVYGFTKEYLNNSCIHENHHRD
jgi:hypothetical protein